MPQPWIKLLPWLSSRPSQCRKRRSHGPFSSMIYPKLPIKHAVIPVAMNYFALLEGRFNWGRHRQVPWRTWRWPNLACSNPNLRFKSLVSIQLRPLYKGVKFTTRTVTLLPVQFFSLDASLAMLRLSCFKCLTHDLPTRRILVTSPLPIATQRSISCKMQRAAERSKSSHIARNSDPGFMPQIIPNKRVQQKQRCTTSTQPFLNRH